MAKLTREDWEKLGAETRCVRNILSNYSQHVERALGKSNPASRSIQKALDDIEKAKCQLDDAIYEKADDLFDDKEIGHVFYGNLIGNQETYMKEFMQNLKV